MTSTPDAFSSATRTGLCECGCGQQTRINTRNSTIHKMVKGQPQRFISGHSARARQRVKGYPHIRLRNGRMLKRHRLRAERALRHPLPVGAVVHHPDEDPENPIARLVICPDKTYHQFLHVRMRVKAAGGNPNTERICSDCHSIRLRTEFARNKARPDGRSNLCIECSNRRSANQRRAAAQR